MPGSWVPIYEICHDNRTGSTKWSHHQLKANNARHQRSVPRILFIQDGFYPGLKVDALYSKYVQRKTFGRILGSDKLAEKYLSNTTDLYLARGHLAAKADFVFGAHQLGTMYYVNAAPQWQSFNNGMSFL